LEILTIYFTGGGYDCLEDGHKSEKCTDVKDWRKCDGEEKSELSIIQGKRKAKDSVFCDLFSDKKYLMELYKTLHPEDLDVTEEMLEIVTIVNVLTDNIYNDLGIMVGGEKLLILVEAQATWSVNVLVRVLMYLAQSYHEYFIKTNQNLYRAQKVNVPKSELYVVYTKDRGDRPDVLSLSEEFYGGVDTALEVKAKVIYESGSGDILNQYIVFCKVFDEQVKRYGLTETAVRETIRACKERNVLSEYLENRRVEVTGIMMSLYDEEEIMRVFLADRDRTVREEAAKEMAKRMIANGKLTLDDIAEYVPSLSMEELKKLEAEVMQVL
jgi:hypothetical protein